MSMALVDCPPAEAQTEGRRCSEALRQGARVHKQSRTSFYDPVRHATCALGALAVGLLGTEAVERGVPGGLRALVMAQTGVDLRRMVYCPVSKQREQLDVAMMFLNNASAGWSREHIADWLESLGL